MVKALPRRVGDVGSIPPAAVIVPSLTIFGAHQQATLATSFRYRPVSSVFRPTGKWEDVDSIPTAAVYIFPW